MNLCTALDQTHLYISILGTRTKFDAMPCNLDSTQCALPVQTKPNPRILPKGGVGYFSNECG